MTRFTRPSRGPKKLRDDGALKTQGDIAAHAAGTLNFAVDRAIYGHKSVKTSLSKMQGNRCAYCETYVKPAHPGNVDHFRPCGAVKQSHGAAPLSPGYFWLAYRWENLLLSCTTCNTSRKGILFPLRHPHLRARCPGQDDQVAEPLFINPTLEDPGVHLRYRGAVAYAVGDSERGRMMRDTFRLNSNRVLLGHRREYLAMFENTVRVAEAHPNLQRRAEAETLIARFLSGRSQYYSMICEAFRAMVQGGEVVRLATLCLP